MEFLHQFVTDFNCFISDMSSLPLGTQIWARMFPFPQFVFGACSGYFVGWRSLGAKYFYCRAISFVIATYIHKKAPFTKLMGPIMHAPMYTLLLFHSYTFIHQVYGLSRGSWSNADLLHYYFIVYTTTITTISLFLDSASLLKYAFTENGA